MKSAFKPAVRGAINSLMISTKRASRGFASFASSSNFNSKSSSSKFGAFAVFGSTVGVLYALNQDNENTAFAADKTPIYGVPGTKKERSFIAIKPDGVNRNLVGEIIQRFEAKGYKLVGIKVVVPSKQLAEKHYADLSARPFFPGLIKYFTSGPVVAMVWEGKGVIAGGRKLVGATDPNAAESGSVRGDYAIQIGRNLIHGSDGTDSAKAEISLWFKEDEVAEYDSALEKWIYE